MAISNKHCAGINKFFCFENNMHEMFLHGHCLYLSIICHTYLCFQHTTVKKCLESTMVCSLICLQVFTIPKSSSKYSIIPSKSIGTLLSTKFFKSVYRIYHVMTHFFYMGIASVFGYFAGTSNTKSNLLFLSFFLYSCLCLCWYEMKKYTVVFLKSLFRLFRIYKSEKSINTYILYCSSCIILLNYYLFLYYCKDNISYLYYIIKFYSYISNSYISYISSSNKKYQCRWQPYWISRKQVIRGRAQFACDGFLRP